MNVRVGATKCGKRFGLADRDGPLAYSDPLTGILGGIDTALG